MRVRRPRTCLCRELLVLVVKNACRCVMIITSRRRRRRTQECLVKVNLLPPSRNGCSAAVSVVRTGGVHALAPTLVIESPSWGTSPPPLCGWLTRARLTRPRGRMQTGATKPARPPCRRDRPLSLRRRRHNNNNNNIFQTRFLVPARELRTRPYFYPPPARHLFYLRRRTVALRTLAASPLPPKPWAPGFSTTPAGPADPSADIRPDGFRIPLPLIRKSESRRNRARIGVSSATRRLS